MQERQSKMSTEFIKDNIPTYLMAAKAEMQGSNLKPFIATDTHAERQYHVYDWYTVGDTFTWTVIAEKPDEFVVTLLIEGFTARVELYCNEQTLSHGINTQWDRIQIGKIKLKTGENTISITSPYPGRGLRFFSIELATESVLADTKKKADSLRSDTKWFRDGKYGLQLHWTSHTWPRHGKKKSYDQAITDFDVTSFAKNVADMGVGHLIFTTSHAEFYFPAPIKAIDDIMPGRTTKRDFVGDLIEALNEYGIRLMLYYHVGHDHWAEKDGWWDRTGFPVSKEKFKENWCNTMREIGERYGKGLAGWFYDDGCCFYYPMNPDFEVFTKAAKHGNPDRIVCYNPWIYPRITDFQDYFCGEGYDCLVDLRFLTSGGNGIFTAGPQEGLQAHSNFLIEDYWLHDKEDMPISPPRFDKEQFVEDVVNAITHGMVPSINIEVYQDGTFADTSVEYMMAIKQRVKP